MKHIVFHQWDMISVQLFKDFNLKTYFPKCLLALTRPATPEARKTSLTNLVFSSFSKNPLLGKNIAYMVLRSKTNFSNRQIKKKSSILYHMKSKSCIEISSQLQSLGFKSTYYHGLTSREKTKICNCGCRTRRKLLLPQMLLEWELTKQM
jgi:ATP-dependent DNA helicase RecQ